MRAAIALLVVAACSTPDRGPRYRGGGAETPRHGGTLTFSTFTNLRSLDPAIAYDEASLYALYYLYETLLDYGEGSELVPGLAERWEVSDDGRVLRFVLREGLTYSDGTPVRAADLAYAWKRVLRLPRSPFPQFLDLVEGATAYAAGEADDVAGLVVDGDRGFEVHLRQRDASFPYVLTMKFTTPLPAAFVEAHDDDLRAAALGTGAFALEGWSEGERVDLVRNDRYWQAGQPYLDRLVYLENVPNEVAFLRFENGELDTVDRLTSADWLWISQRDDWAPYIQTSAAMSTYGSRIDVTQPPFDDVRVRRALNHAVDKQHTVKLRGGLATPSHGLLPPGMVGRDDALGPYPYDPALARRLLAEAGYPDGFTVEYVTLKDDNAEKLAQSMQADLAAVGVKVDIRLMSWATFLDATGRPGGPPFSLGSWLADYPDPTNFLDVRFHSRSIDPDYSNNDSFYRNDEVDRLLDEARGTLDPDARAALYRRVERILYDDAPWIWDYHPLTVEVSQPYLRGFSLHPVLQRDFRRVWLDLGPDGERLAR